jgi:hypothetical protein
MTSGSVTVKQCTKCRRELPATREYFHLHGPSSDGLKPSCKECRRSAVNQRYAAQSPAERAAYLQRAADWAARNRNRTIVYSQNWRRENPERRRVIKAEFHQRKKATDTRYRLCHAISSAISKSLRGKQKAGRRWQDLVGYTADELRTHLESLFLPGMTWANHGEWHIDHKRPIASFTITSADDAAFRDCWALSNLQPLWAEQNLRKWAKWAS